MSYKNGMQKAMYGVMKDFKVNVFKLIFKLESRFI